MGSQWRSGAPGRQAKARAWWGVGDDEPALSGGRHSRRRHRRGRDRRDDRRDRGGPAADRRLHAGLREPAGRRRLLRRDRPGHGPRRRGGRGRRRCDPAGRHRAALDPPCGRHRDRAAPAPAGDLSALCRRPSDQGLSQRPAAPGRPPGGRDRPGDPARIDRGAVLFGRGARPRRGPWRRRGPGRPAHHPPRHREAARLRLPPGAQAQGARRQGAGHLRRQGQRLPLHGLLPQDLRRARG